MKKMYYLLFTMVLIIAGCSSVYSVSQITVTVVDAKTKKPIKGVLVVYRLKTYCADDYPQISFKTRKEPPNRQRIYVEKLTNEKGEVSFESEKFELDFGEELSYEQIFVNLDLNKNAKDKIKKYYEDCKNPNEKYLGELYDVGEYENFKNINKRYRGFVLTNFNCELKDYSRAYSSDPTVWDMFDVKDESNAFMRNRNVEIELNRTK